MTSSVGERSSITKGLALVIAVLASATTNAQSSCTADDIAGTYPTSFGELECRANGPGLDCCYGYSGDECVSAIMLQPSADQSAFTGEWTYFNGTSGVIEFGLNDDCTLSNGLWGAESLDSVWGVSARTALPPPVTVADGGPAATTAASEPASAEPAGEAAAVPATATTAATEAASMAAGPAELALVPGIWEGTLECGRGTTYVTVSTDIHPFAGIPNSAAARIDFADSPGGHPIARSYTSIGVLQGRAAIVAKTWIFRPLDFASLTGQNARTEVSVSADGRTMTSGSFGNCGAMQLRKMPDFVSRGGVESAEDLPPVLEGTLGCYGGTPTYYMRLRLTPTGDKSFNGQVVLQPVEPTQRDDLIAYQVFGEFEPDAAELTVIGDRWIRESRYLKETFDFTGTIRQAGQRLVGQGPSDWGSCGVVDLYVPDSDQSQIVSLPLTSLPPEQWESPSACATLITWARQSWVENRGLSVYSQAVQAQAHEIGIGLFAEERFAPFFSMSFAELTAAQRQQVVDVAEACRRQAWSAGEIYESGAMQYVSGFFPDSASGEWLKLRRFDLLRRRLTDEMALLELRAVGEVDVGPLQATMAELPGRFSELWQADLAEARSLISSKIETAKGIMIDRLEGEITALPIAWEAFATGKRIRSELPALGEDHSEEQAMLGALLDARLGEATDAVLAEIDQLFVDRSASLNTLQALRNRIDSRWPDLDPYVDTGKPGFKALDQTVSTMAKATLPSFKSKTRGMIDENEQFDNRIRQYGYAMKLYFRLVPMSVLFEKAFVPYASHIEALVPVPTYRDLVAEDGSPTSLGLRFSIRAAVESAISGFLSRSPVGLGRLMNAMHVTDVRKIGCSQSMEGGYWCDYSMQTSAPAMLSSILSQFHTSARLVLTDLTWMVVEFPPTPPPRSSTYDAIRQQGDAQQQIMQNASDEVFMNP